MKTPGRSLNRLMLVMTLGMGLLSAVVLLASLCTIRGTLENFNGSLEFNATQLEFELDGLLYDLSNLSDPKSEVTASGLDEKLDSIRVRVEEFGNSASGSDEFKNNSEMSGLLQDVQTMAGDFTTFMTSLTLDDFETLAEMKSQTRVMIPRVQKLIQTLQESNEEAQLVYLNKQLRQSYLTFAFVIGAVFFGILTILLLRHERRNTIRLNIQLEERVLKRTSDLQSANARLAAEIAERRRQQDTMTERETRLAQAVRLAQLGFFVWNMVDQCCEFASEEFAEAHGLTPEECLRQMSSVKSTLSLVHPSDHNRLIARFNELLTGSSIETDYRVITGGNVRRLRVIARSLFDVTGQVVRVIGTTLDVTEQHETEMKLFEAQRMDSIGKMTGGVAHDFNNLLAVILGNLELLDEVPHGPERDEMVQEAIKATLRGRDLTMSMLSFARRAPLDPKELDLNEVIGELESMLRRTLPGNIRLRTELASGLWTVTADRSLTESALLNLTINARDAMPDGGQLLIQTRNRKLGPDDVWDVLEPGDYVEMSVVDTGSGIQPEALDHIFEPFFTTKAIAKNSGLGLSMVQGFISQTGGAVRVESSPGAGASFSLYFGAVQDGMVEAAQAPASEIVSMRSHALRILLVEDDDNVRRVLARQMEQAGLDVIQVENADRALSLFKAHDRFDLVVSDIVMPGRLQGPALISHLRSAQPDLPAILLSGYPVDQNNFAQTNGDVVDVTLMKPVSREALLTAIETAVTETVTL